MTAWDAVAIVMLTSVSAYGTFRAVRWYLLDTFGSDQK